VQAGGTEPGGGLITFGFTRGDREYLQDHQRAVELKFLVVGDNYQIETATFWKGRAVRRARSSRSRPGVQLPCSGFAETMAASPTRPLAAVEVEGARSPGQAKTDQEVLARILLAVRDLYRKEGAPCLKRCLNVSWNYSTPASPDLGEVLKEINGRRSRT